MGSSWSQQIKKHDRFEVDNLCIITNPCHHMVDFYHDNKIIDSIEMNGNDITDLYISLNKEVPNHFKQYKVREIL
jgi:hypothetical protein